MFRLIVSICLLVLAAESSFIRLPRPRLDGRIVGGVVTDIEHRPFQISLQTSGHICGGTLIEKTVVVTAAHCTYGGSASQFKVRVGSSTHASGGAIVRVKKIHQHPLFSYSNIDYDYSVLILEDYDDSKLTVGYADLPEQNEQLPTGTPVTISGWGNTQSSTESRDVLREVTVPTIDAETCNQAYKSYGGITDRMMCAGLLGQGGKDACQGDSGGPLTAGNTLYGIVSWGFGCAERDYPGVYSHVAVAVDYIKKSAADK